MKKILAILLATLLMVSLAACAKKPVAASTTPDAPVISVTGPLTDAIKAKGTLVVGTEAMYAPYEFKDASGNIVGFDMWLAQKIADAMGVKLEVIDMGFDGIIPAIQTKAVDMGIAGFSPKPERAEAVDFSEIYYAGGQSVVVMKDKVDTYVDAASLAGFTLGAQKGSIQADIAAEQFPDSKALILDAVPSLILELQNGNIQGVIMETAVAQNYAKANPDLVVSNVPVTVDESQSGSVVCMPKGSTDLVEYVNAVIDAVKNDGTFDTAIQDAFAQAENLPK